MEIANLIINIATLVIVIANFILTISLRKQNKSISNARVQREVKAEVEKMFGKLGDSFGKV